MLSSVVLHSRNFALDYDAGELVNWGVMVAECLPEACFVSPVGSLMLKTECLQRTQ